MWAAGGPTVARSIRKDLILRQQRYERVAVGQRLASHEAKEQIRHAKVRGHPSVRVAQLGLRMDSSNGRLDFE